MPAKGRRVASRQAQLGRRKRKQNRSLGDAPSDGFSTAVADRQPEDRVATPTPETTATPQNARPVAPSRPASASLRRSPARVRGERPLAYNYVGPELRRILILAGTLIIVLIILSFLL